jgi:hypothetical protein
MLLSLMPPIKENEHLGTKMAVLLSEIVVLSAGL